MAPPAQSGLNMQALRQRIGRMHNVVRLRRCCASRTSSALRLQFCTAIGSVYQGFPLDHYSDFHWGCTKGLPGARISTPPVCAAFDNLSKTSPEIPEVASKAKLSTERIVFSCTGGTQVCAAGEFKPAAANRIAFVRKQDRRVNSRCQGFTNETNDDRTER